MAEVPLKLIRSARFLALIACFLALDQLSLALATQSESTNVTPKSPPILITARNKDGTPAELSASDVELKLDGESHSVEVRRLSPQLRYCLLLDVSGSLKDRLKQEQDEAIALLSKIPKPGRDQGLLVAFNTESYLDAASSDPQQLIKAISSERAQGYTALYDAIGACADSMIKTKTVYESDLRVMFIFSDGDDNASFLKPDGTLQFLAKARVRVYSIGHGRHPKSVNALKQFAENTGGRNYFPANQDDLERILADISDELADIYSVKILDTPRSDHVYKVGFKVRKKDTGLSAPRQYFVPLQ